MKTLFFVWYYREKHDSGYYKIYLLHNSKTNPMKRDSKKLKVEIRAIVIISLLNVTSLLLISMGSNTPLQQDEKNVLFNKWYQAL